MLAELDPLYMKHERPDVVRSVQSGLFNSYDYSENPIFFYPVLRVPTELMPFSWEPIAVGSNFWDIIKNQVHIFPGLYVDFGLVLSQREIPYYIWNAWTTRTATIKEPVPQGDYGTTFVFNIAGDFVLQPGQGTGGLLTCFIEGPISSATDFHIEVEVQDILDP